MQQIGVAAAENEALKIWRRLLVPAKTGPPLARLVRRRDAPLELREVLAKFSRSSREDGATSADRKKTFFYKKLVNYAIFCRARDPNPVPAFGCIEADVYK